MTFNFSPEQISGLNFATKKRNAANPNSEPMTSEEFAKDLLEVQLNSFAAEAHSLARAEMTPIADALIAASSDVRDKILANAIAELKKQGLF